MPRLGVDRRRFGPGRRASRQASCSTVSWAAPSFVCTWYRLHRDRDVDVAVAIVVNMDVEVDVDIDVDADTDIYIYMAVAIAIAMI